MIQILGVKVNNLTHYSLICKSSGFYFQALLKPHPDMKTLLLSLLLLSSSLFVGAQIDMSLALLSGQLSDPVGLTNAGDDRLFINQKSGEIRIMSKAGVLNETHFLDISGQVSTQSERGLLGLAFHPNYAENGYFYVNYTDNSGNTVVSRFSVSAEDPDVADPASEKVLLTATQPFRNHNGGDLHFGPDGYLYIALGDGGDGGDPEDNGQERQTLLGKILRIDVDNGDPYSIPQDNPFAQTDETLDEIWALGLRNPWRFSFDRLTGDMYIGDVGQGNQEEINFQPASSTGGENYGWRCYEGDLSFNTTGCGPSADYVFPVHVYESNLPVGCSVTGGFVYRGTTFPLLYGKYIYTDYCSGIFWALEQGEDGAWINTELFNGADYRYVSLGEDKEGELYLVCITGEIFQIRDMTTPVREPALAADLQVRPNPFQREFWVEGNLPENGLYRLQLLNAQGQIVWEESRQLDTQFQQNISTEALSKGIYLFRIERNGAALTRKIIKE